MEVEISGRKLEVKEIGYIKAMEVAELQVKSQSKAIRELIKSSTELTYEEIDSLGVKDGIELQKKVNEMNDLGDFQEPIKENDQS